MRGVAFWGRNPVDDGSRADYFDSLHHSSAVVGLNAKRGDAEAFVCLPNSAPTRKERSISAIWLMGDS